MNKPQYMFRIEYTEGAPGAQMECVALFDARRISEEDAREAIRNHGTIYCPDVVCMTKEQFENVFGELREACRVQPDPERSQEVNSRVRYRP